MKKTLIALAVLAASGASFAQSSVTLYGVVDAGITNNGKTTTFTGGGVNGTPRLGVKGEEDLGGGLKAVFQMETAFNSGAEKATMMGDRGAFVGVAGSFGTVALGSSVLSPSFQARAAVDASTANNYSIAKYAGATRLDNSINYTSPTMSGLTFRAATVQKDDNGGTAATDFSIVYANGPLTLAASSADNGAGGKGTLIGGAYDMRVAKVLLTSVDINGGEKHTSLGVSAPIGAWTLQADYRMDKNADIKTYVVSAQYALSKRSSVTAYTAKADNADAVMGVGIRHNF